ncbi:hypothetical protein ACQ4WM_12290 [Janthinobacterium sp. RB2R34]
MTTGTIAVASTEALNAIDKARTKTVFLNMWFPIYSYEHGITAFIKQSCLRLMRFYAFILKPVVANTILSCSALQARHSTVISAIKYNQGHIGTYCSQLVNNA